MDELAEQGLTYTKRRAIALYSPTRSSLLTGRNHYLNGMAAITDTADRFPGASGRFPPKVTTIAEVLRANGYSTFWIGKIHNAPKQDVASGASHTERPLNLRFDRFCGFLGGKTNQWYPDLVEDNHFIEQPYGPNDGYRPS